jgi:hypothetical protein
VNTETIKGNRQGDGGQHVCNAAYHAPLEESYGILQSALANYRAFHASTTGAARVTGVQQSSAGILVWAGAEVGHNSAFYYYADEVVDAEPEAVPTFRYTEEHLVSQQPREQSGLGVNLKREVEILQNLPQLAGTPPFVKARWKTSCSEMRLCAASGDRKADTVFLRCRAHHQCKVGWKVQRAPASAETSPTGTLRFYQHGLPHTEVESSENKHWYKLDMKKRIAADGAGPTPGRMKLLRIADVEKDAAHFPSAREVTRWKSKSQGAERAASSTLTVEGLAPLVESVQYTESLEGHVVFYEPDFSEFHRFTCVPFSTTHFLDAFAAFTSRCSGDITLVYNFTHDVCRQRFKLGIIAAVGTHWDGTMWRNTVVPGFCAIASREVSGATLPTAQALSKRLLERSGLDLRPLVKRAILDGNPGLATAMQSEFGGGCRHSDCLHTRS